MPGFNSKVLAQNVLNANNVVVMIGDSAIAFAQTTGHQIAMGTEGLYGIGNSKPQEIQQLRMSPAFTIDNFVLTSAGTTLLSGGQRLEYLLAGQSFDMHVVDGITNTTLYSYVGCKAQNVAQNIPSNAPLRSTFSFLALDVLDTNGASIMDAPVNALTIGSASVSAVAAVNNLGLSV